MVTEADIKAGEAFSDDRDEPIIAGRDAAIECFAAGRAHAREELVARQKVLEKEAWRLYPDDGSTTYQTFRRLAFARGVYWGSEALGVE